MTNLIPFPNSPAPRASTRPARHTCNGGNGPVFGRRTAGCPRCEELKAGAEPVRWGPSRADRDAEKVRRMRLYPHNCAASGCGPVCTWGDW